MLKASIFLPALILSLLLTLLQASSYSAPVTSKEDYATYPRDRNRDTKSLEDLLKARSDAQRRNKTSSKDRYLTTVPKRKKLFRRIIQSTALFAIVISLPKFFHFFLINLNEPKINKIKTKH